MCFSVFIWISKARHNPAAVYCIMENFSFLNKKYKTFWLFSVLFLTHLIIWKLWLGRILFDQSIINSNPVAEDSGQKSNCCVKLLLDHTWENKRFWLKEKLSFCMLTHERTWHPSFYMIFSDQAVSISFDKSRKKSRITFFSMLQMPIINKFRKTSVLLRFWILSKWLYFRSLILFNEVLN